MAAVTGDDLARRAVELAEAAVEADKGADELVAAAAGVRHPLEDARVVIYDRLSRTTRPDPASDRALLLLEAALAKVGWQADWASDAYVHRPWVR